MNGILLTQDDGISLGPVAKVLGFIMEAIFTAIDAIGIPNIGLAIILFTIVVNLLMLPLTIKQQKFSKLSAKMSPEIDKIREKYKNKKDDASVMAQNQEIQAVYAKYGVSPTGSCGYLLIQMPILFALYRVIYAIPAYVGKVKEAFFPLVDKLIETEGASELVQGFYNSAMYLKQFESDSFVAGNTEYMQNTFIDCLNKASTAEFLSISEKFPELANDVSNTLAQLDVYNNFLGINMGNSPWYTIKEAWANGAWLVLIGALAIPVLSAATQWINAKLMPQQDTSKNTNGNDTASSMAQSMKTMNTIMPLMSAWFCFTLPSGMGLYWIAGSVVRSIQQVVINKHIDKLDFDEIIRKNSEKSAKKLEKMKENQAKLDAYAKMNTKNIQSKASYTNTSSSDSKQSDKSSTGYYNSNAKAGSMMSKANMVKDFNERNNKGNK